MDLITLWFCIIGFLFAGFFLLEGFDYGVGILQPFLSKGDEDRRMLMGSIGGVWDGNEVWLITSGAVLFAAFPDWYASLFSSFYPVFTVILFALIFRGVSLKFRDQRSSFLWRRSWDAVFFVSSLGCAFFWGLVVGNLLRGIPLGQERYYYGGLADFFSPYAVVTGILFVTLFSFHGRIFLGLRVTGGLLKRVEAGLLQAYIPTVAMAVIFLAYSYFEIGLLGRWREWMAVGAAVFCLLGCGVVILFKRSLLAAFVLSGFMIVSLTAAVFAFLYPRVLISSLNPEWSLTVYNSSASPYSLKVMSVVAVIFIPLVLLYQGWTYWVLRKRLERADLDH